VGADTLIALRPGAWEEAMAFEIVAIHVNDLLDRG
jgi:hypothetical protein